MISQLERGLLTEGEFVNEFLFIVCDVDDLPRIAALFAHLPEDVQSAVRTHLYELEGCDFIWQPLVIGVGPSDVELERLRGRLRTIYSTLCSK
ncbi:MAG: hypothetical protein DWQ31_06920 [Planctomycetota bacterium]|nr:MAG: hypothetical protein DWQ31_06920 [Planctomycetota bacterium]REJ93001.1 MAG: hypothetical protein DWQ35_11220 [Planctomycetota bacterium]REK22655.1 MAG: hypothetical protein DWQ42_16665 [Planctomycetota bacterium]REK37784.1 MAG: hypothetical protein DWQ46_21785 [Planctomycetota bacterium]